MCRICSQLGNCAFRFRIYKTSLWYVAHVLGRCFGSINCICFNVIFIRACMHVRICCCCNGGGLKSAAPLCTCSTNWAKRRNYASRVCYIQNIHNSTRIIVEKHMQKLSTFLYISVNVIREAVYRKYAEMQILYKEQSRKRWGLGAPLEKKGIRMLVGTSFWCLCNNRGERISKLISDVDAVRSNYCKTNTNRVFLYVV